MRPNFGQIKGIERKMFGLLKCHHLNEHGIRGKVSFRNGIVKITNGKVGIISGHVVCLLPIKAFDTLICLVMKLRKIEKTPFEKIREQYQGIQKTATLM